MYFSRIYIENDISGVALQSRLIDYQIERVVCVLKTNLKNEMDVHQLRIFLALKSEILDWSVDLDDCDRVLRVESLGLEVQDLIRCVKYAGFDCEVLQ